MSHMASKDLKTTWFVVLKPACLKTYFDPNQRHGGRQEASGHEPSERHTDLPGCWLTMVNLAILCHFDFFYRFFGKSS